MALTSGTKLGPYEIQSPLGAGGMGEVYRATDTRLNRTVAIKVLASHLSSSPELKQRMELALPGTAFELAELVTAVGLLAGPGMIQRVDFGGFILLRPEVLSRYAAAVVRKVVVVDRHTRHRRNAVGALEHNGHKPS